MRSAYALEFEVSPRDLQRLKANPVLWRRGGKSADERYLVSVYFDTPNRALADRDVWLRVRHIGHKRIQTIRNEADVARSRRGFRRKLDGEVPALEGLPDAALDTALIGDLTGRLRPVFQTRLHRSRISDRTHASQIVVTFDEGQFRAGSKVAPISEIKLELKEGNPADVVRLARRINELVPASWTVRSKGRRGYDLIAGAPTTVVQPRKILLRSRMSAAEAFRIIARSILRDLAANQAAVRDLAPEGVHRMRIDLRRLRAALSVFSDLFGDTQTRRINAELQWLAGKLGTARDLDVLATTVGRLRRRSNRRGLRAFAAELATRRASAFDDAKTAIQSRRYRKLLLDALQWIEAGDWSTQPRSDIGHCRIKTLAADILTRRAKKVMAMAGRFEQLDAGQRHKFRIAVKKLRYSADFFQSLFPGRSARKRHADFIEGLKTLQDCLGALNDIVVHRALVSKVARGDARARRQTREVASGILSDRERHISGRLLKAAGKAAVELSDAKPFWR